jgi:hypothetical protein
MGWEPSAEMWVCENDIAASAKRIETARDGGFFRFHFQNLRFYFRFFRFSLTNEISYSIMSVMLFISFSFQAWVGLACLPRRLEDRRENSYLKGDRMKTTRRKFLQGLGAAIAGLFAAKREQEHIAKKIKPNAGIEKHLDLEDWDFIGVCIENRLCAEMKASIVEFWRDFRYGSSDKQPAGFFSAEDIAKINRDFDDAIVNGVEGGTMPVGVLSAEYPELDADPYDPTYENDNFSELAMQVAADTGGILTVQGIDLEGNRTSETVELIEQVSAALAWEEDYKFLQGPGSITNAGEAM